MADLRLKQKDLIDKHKSKPAIIFGHGPSLGTYKNKIDLIKTQHDPVLFALNNWFQLYDIGDKPPDYWIMASNIDTIAAYISEVQKYKSTLLFADTVDLVNCSSLEEILDCDFLPYDQRHFKGHTCTQIWDNYDKHILKENYHDFVYYGNNSMMWKPAPETGYPGLRWYRPEYLLNNKPSCCMRIQNPQTVIQEANIFFATHSDPEGAHKELNWEPTINSRLTIQEQLQETSQSVEHYSPGDTVILHAIAFAIIMGCSPIYVGGMDLDYSGGYVGGNTSPTDDVWQKQHENLRNDLRILNESAKNRNIKIINLHDNPWYNEFEQGRLL